MTVYRIVLRPTVNTTEEPEVLAPKVEKAVAERIGSPMQVVVEGDQLVLTRENGSYWHRSILAQLRTDFAHGPFHDYYLDFQPDDEIPPFPTWPPTD